MTDDDIIHQVSKSIQSLFELTTRVDEQVKNIKEYQEKMEKRLDTALNSQSDLLTRVMVLESKNGKEIQQGIKDAVVDVRENAKMINSLDKRLTITEGFVASQDAIWKKAVNWAVYFVVTLLLCYVVYRLEISTPPLP